MTVFLLLTTASLAGAQAKDEEKLNKRLVKPDLQAQMYTF